MPPATGMAKAELCGARLRSGVSDVANIGVDRVITYSKMVIVGMMDVDAAKSADEGARETSGWVM
jgi:hypothetical protein